MPSTEISLKQGQMITSPRELISAKEAEIAEGEIILEQLSQIKNISKTKVARVRGRINFQKRLLAMLKEGYLPIPRLEYEPVTQEYFGGRKGWTTSIVIDQLPMAAIVTIAEFQDKFDRFGIVRPRSRGKRRDPLLIGIIRYGGMEEHFVLAWWRPDIMPPNKLW